VSLVYSPRPRFPEAIAGIGLIMSQAPGRGVGEVYEKGVGPGTSLQSLRVGNQPALWITGPPHRISYVSPSGGGLVSEGRLAANVLALEQGGLIIRVEGRMDREEAIRVATSLR